MEKTIQMENHIYEWTKGEMDGLANEFKSFTHTYGSDTTWFLVAEETAVGGIADGYIESGNDPDGYIASLLNNPNELRIEYNDSLKRIRPTPYKETSEYFAKERKKQVKFQRNLKIMTFIAGLFYIILILYLIVGSEK